MSIGPTSTPTNALVGRAPPCIIPYPHQRLMGGNGLRTMALAICQDMTVDKAGDRSRAGANCSANRRVHLGLVRPSIREATALGLADRDLGPCRIIDRTIVPGERKLVAITVEMFLADVVERADDTALQK